MSGELHGPRCAPPFPRRSRFHTTCIGLVKQAATLQVGEQGTTASAATAVGIEPTAARPGLPPVTFDRPYLMVVTDTATGEPLIMARVADPSA